MMLVAPVVTCCPLNLAIVLGPGAVILERHTVVGSVRLDRAKVTRSILLVAGLNVELLGFGGRANHTRRNIGQRFAAGVAAEL